MKTFRAPPAADFKSDDNQFAESSGVRSFSTVHRSVVSHSCRKRFLFYALMVSSAKSVHIQSLSGGHTFAAFDCRVSLPCQETGAIATGRDFVDAVDGDESNALLEGNNDEDDERVMGSPAVMHEHPDVLKAVVASMHAFENLAPSQMSNAKFPS